MVENSRRAVGLTLHGRERKPGMKGNTSEFAYNADYIIDHSYHYCQMCRKSSSLMMISVDRLP
jgi:hypothetical protein